MRLLLVGLTIAVIVVLTDRCLVRCASIDNDEDEKDDSKAVTTTKSPDGDSKVQGRADNEEDTDNEDTKRRDEGKSRAGALPGRRRIFGRKRPMMKDDDKHHSKKETPVMHKEFSMKVVSEIMKIVGMWLQHHASMHKNGDDDDEESVDLGQLFGGTGRQYESMHHHRDQDEYMR